MILWRNLGNYHREFPRFYYTVNPVFSDHIQQDIFLAIQTVDCLFLLEISAEMNELSALISFSNKQPPFK